jgi:hypothetical protein
VSIRHFVGEHLTLSLIDNPEQTEEFPGPFRVRIAKERDAGQWTDLNGEQWAEVVSVVHMIDATQPKIPMPIAMGMMHLGEDDDETGT